MDSMAYGLRLYGFHVAILGARGVLTPLKVCLYEVINLLPIKRLLSTIQLLILSPPRHGGGDRTSNGV